MDRQGKTRYSNNGTTAQTDRRSILPQKWGEAMEYLVILAVILTLIAAILNRPHGQNRRNKKD